MQNKVEIKLFDGNISVLPIEEFSRVLGCNTETIRRYIRAGELPARKIGRKYFIMKEGFYLFMMQAIRQKKTEGKL
jgi:excisionase family DNA binding protein